MATIRVKRNDSFAREIKIFDKNGDLQNCTGWTIYFTIRSSVPQTSETNDTEAIISKIITGESSGIHTLELTSSETNIDPASYVFDIQVKKSDDTISSSETGVFVIQADITRSV